ncbi:MAG: 3-oxoadipate enol-lactonase [Candidatus Poriferisodalaceae bacterium]|jgi:3-oxoadipate enol-lactonase
MDHTMFDSQVDALSDRYRCVAWDERGFGGTPATGEFSYWDSAADAVALLDHLGINQAVFAGMSQGGFLSLRAALGNPDRVRALVLIDTQPGIDDQETIEGYHGMIAHWTSDEPLGEVGQFVASLILGDEALTAEWIPRWEAARSDGMVHAAGALLGRDDITSRMGEISCPALIVHGEADQAITIDKAEEMQAMLSDCRGLIRIPGAAHAPNMTDPQIVNPALEMFLASLG